MCSTQGPSISLFTSSSSSFCPRLMDENSPPPPFLPPSLTACPSQTPEVYNAAKIALHEEVLYMEIGRGGFSSNVTLEEKRTEEVK